MVVTKNRISVVRIKYLTNENHFKIIPSYARDAIVAVAKRNVMILNILTSLFIFILRFFFKIFQFSLQFCKQLIFSRDTRSSYKLELICRSNCLPVQALCRVSCS